MLVRALFILLIVAGASVALTVYFGENILLALGLILVQIKLVAKKVATVQWPAILTWLKAEASSFFRIELLKKWAMTTLLPLALGNAFLRRIERFIGGYRQAIRARYDGMIDWYGGLGPVEKVITALIVLFVMLALTVSSLGLWLILFSVKLPFWLMAGVAATVQMVWASIRKMAFKAVAFFQLRWLWRVVRKGLPETYLERKRRFDFRVARMVVRRRRMTVRQLAARKDSIGLRLSLLRELFRQRRQRPRRTDPESLDNATPAMQPGGDD